MPVDLRIVHVLQHVFQRVSTRVFQRKHRSRVEDTVADRDVMLSDVPLVFAMQLFHQSSFNL